MGSMFDDTLLGDNNNDTFQGLAGNDYIDGRGGFDIAQYNNLTYTTGSIAVNMAAGIVVGDATNGTDTLRSIEGIQGTNGADTYDATGYGLAGALNVGNNGTFNQFEGLGGNDTITGNGNTRGNLHQRVRRGHGRPVARAPPMAPRPATSPASATTSSPAVSSASPVRPSTTR